MRDARRHGAAIDSTIHRHRGISQAATAANAGIRRNQRPQRALAIKTWGPRPRRPAMIDDFSTGFRGGRIRRVSAAIRHDIGGIDFLTSPIGGVMAVPSAKKNHGGIP